MALTVAAFGRFPERLLPSGYFYGGVDLLILLSVVRDMIVQRSVHRIYYYVLPAFIAGQTIVTYTVFPWPALLNEDCPRDFAIRGFQRLYDNSAPT
jgi:hypothetical protein